MPICRKCESMKFPWVSRERLAEVQKRLEAADVERARLLDLLLSGAAPDKRREIAAVEAADEPGNASESVSAAARPVEAFSTPFDRVERLFAQTFPQGAKIPAKYMAKVN